LTADAEGLAFGEIILEFTVNRQPAHRCPDPSLQLQL